MITHLCHHITVLVLLEIGHIGIVSGAVWSATSEPSNVDNFHLLFSINFTVICSAIFFLRSLPIADNPSDFKFHVMILVNQRTTAVALQVIHFMLHGISAFFSSSVKKHLRFRVLTFYERRNTKRANKERSVWRFILALIHINSDVENVINVIFVIVMTMIMIIMIT